MFPIFLTQAQDMKSMNMSKKEISPKVQPVTYTCTMHPEIHSTKPGNCPKCGMKLIKEKSKTQPTKKMDMPMPKDTAKQQNTMQGMNMSNMPMEKAQPALYTCVMHPEIHSTKLGNCPKCGMKLIKEKSKTQPTKKMDMSMPKDAVKHQHNKQGMDMKGMDMKSDTTKNKMMQMDGMEMNMSADPTYTTFNKKYIPNNTPPRTVRYDLYIYFSSIAFGKR